MSRGGDGRGGVEVRLGEEGLGSGRVRGETESVGFPVSVVSGVPGETLRQCRLLCLGMCCLRSVRCTCKVAVGEVITSSSPPSPRMGAARSVSGLSWG